MRPTGNRSRGVMLLLAAALALGLAAPRALPAQPRQAPARGMLLVAGEDMADPRFQEAVVLILRYDTDGVAGLILNRPTVLTIAEALPEMAGARQHPDPIFYGGPLSPRMLTVLLESRRPPAGSDPVAGNLYVTGPPQFFERTGPPQGEVERFRVFLGYAGWTPAQLAGEIARGDWYVLPCDPQAVFAADPQGLWRQLRARGQEIWI